MALHVHDHGDPAAPPLVLIHGLTDDGTCWPDAVARWERDHHVLAVDQRGHGRSPGFSEEQFRRVPEVMRDDVAAVLRQLGRPAILVGHSLGGLVAARVAQGYPELVRAIVLEDPAKPAPHWDGANTEFSRQQLAFVEAVTQDPDGEVTRMLQETPWTDTELEPWAESKARVDREYLRRGLYLGDTAWEEMFSALTVPTLIVVPVDGEMAPDPARIDNDLVEVVEIPGAGHCIRRDRPDEFHAVVDAFLDRHR
ncbi:alpha/beta hydrolase [Tessaracoccus lubricantis]|uniref:Alpha/beta hydrolase n=1 Tax=Tessaracoccus lubricantis TaxID=545543 RepID=A0ABP9F9T5_9ACTN